MEERRGERRSVKEICTSTEPNGDSTWNYRIELERKYSLNEFIEYVLRENRRSGEVSSSSMAQTRKKL